VTAPPPARLLRPAALLVLVYLAVTLLTVARFQGDTVDYVAEVFSFDRGAWDFGHLWWVPSGWLLSGGGELRLVADDPDGRISVALVFLAINWLAGLACVLLLFALLVRLGFRTSLALFVTAGFLFAQAFLNFAQTGSSYIPGLALLLLALYLALAGTGTRTAVGAGLALGAAVCLWFPYALAAPGVVLAPLLLGVWSRTRFWLAVRTAGACAAVLLLAYGVAAVQLGINDPVGLKAWVARSSHGATARGATRMAFGLARSFLFMGEDGVLFKRYLLKDPFNPVSLGELFRLSLWKFLFFWAALLALLVNLLRSATNRRLLGLLLAGAAPVVAFGIFWQGGDMERYLPLYPFLFLAISGALSAQDSWRILNVVVAGLLVAVIVVNGLALSRWQVERYHSTLVARVEALQPRLKPGSRVVIVRDPLKLLPRDFPLDRGHRGLVIAEAVTPGQADAPRWRAAFRELAEATWKEGGDVWLSRRLLAEAPPADSAWVEGDDPRLSWADLHGYFSRLEVGVGVGGPDGFVRLLDSPRTRRELAAGS
jgi:hypothetical protein